MTRRIILLLTVVCFLIVAFTFTLPFVQRDIYSSQSIFDIFTGKQPKFLRNRILHGDYYKAYLGIALAYLVVQAVILLVRNSKLVAVFNAIIGLAGLMLIVFIALMLYNDSLDMNFKYLIGFYIFILSLIAKNAADWLFLRSKLKQNVIKTPISKDQHEILDSTNL